MRRWFPHPLLSLLLTLTWLLLNNSLAPGQLLLGLLLGWAIPRLAWVFWPEPLPIHKPWLLARLVTRVFYDMLLANIAVAKLVLGRRPPNPVFVEMPLRLRNDFAISLLANIVCLTPGTLVARLSADRQRFVIHALDVTDAKALIVEIQDRYETLLYEVFEC